VNRKTVLLIDDELVFLDALADALEFEGFRVLKARTADQGIRFLKSEKIDLVTIDIMMDPGESLRSTVQPHEAGIYVCEYVAKHHPQLDAFCISVVNEEKKIRQIESFGVKFLRKGETPLRTVLNMLRSRLTGIAYSTERDTLKGRKRH
jgi:two-component system nitrogen regulation response regulator NtrX